MIDSHRRFTALVTESCCCDCLFVDRWRGRRQQPRERRRLKATRSPLQHLSRSALSLSTPLLSPAVYKMSSPEHCQCSQFVQTQVAPERLQCGNGRDIQFVVLYVDINCFIKSPTLKWLLHSICQATRRPKLFQRESNVEMAITFDLSYYM